MTVLYSAALATGIATGDPNSGELSLYDGVGTIVTEPHVLNETGVLHVDESRLTDAQKVSIDTMATEVDPITFATMRRYAMFPDNSIHYNIEI